MATTSDKGGLVKKAMMMLSVGVSLVMTFLLTAQIYNGTSGWVKDYTVLNYGAWTEGLVSVLWFLVSAFMVFAFFNLMALILIWLVFTYLASRGWIK
ncbi:hypothetical protein J3E64_001543 [Sphingobium sp. OAS761]|uniref:hypothetical protein n=1 Tax=Sphingobium sp. OAS761 TaxID=2817901 RepID=UPI0020A1CEA1|nr:hypothetical protein [Sphingobium sp. OAS761]MCP1469861.1 hypothetical protein [Sphingobium sp. OAS761]